MMLHMLQATSIKIKRLSVTDHDTFAALIRFFEEAFEMDSLPLPSHTHLHQLLEREDFFAVTALQEGHVVGGLTAYTLQQYHTEKPLIYLYDLAVSSTFRRQGIGKRLVTWLSDHCHSTGAEMFVQAYEEDAHALDFYHAIGGSAQKVVHFTIR